MFWQAVENMKTNCKDGKARQARAMIITKKYFINISVPAGKYLAPCNSEYCDINLLLKVILSYLIGAQHIIKNQLWYIATPEIWLVGRQWYMSSYTIDY